MPSIRKIALISLLAALATDARPVKGHEKRQECSRPAAVTEQMAVAGAGRQGAWGRHRWGSFGGHGDDEDDRDNDPSFDKQEGGSSWPKDDDTDVNGSPTDVADSDFALPSAGPEVPGSGSLLGPSGTEDEAPMETFPSIVDDLGGASVTSALTEDGAIPTAPAQGAVDPVASAVGATDPSASASDIVAPTVSAQEGTESSASTQDATAPTDPVSELPEPTATAEEPTATSGSIEAAAVTASVSGIELIPITAQADAGVNMAFRPGGGRGGNHHRPSEQAQQPAPSAAVTAPIVATAPVPVPEPASTLWDNPGSGPIVDPADLSTSAQAPAPTVAAPVPASSATAPASAVNAAASDTVSAPAPATGSSSGGKAGMAINESSGSDWTSWASGSVSWLYNWASAPPAGLPSSIEYVPMLWGADADKVTKFNADLANFDNWGVTHILGFNEPDIARGYGGSDISAAVAATTHKQVFTAEVAGKYKIGSPAVARGGKQWLSDWEAACAGGCAYDFVPIHFYGKDASMFADYLQEMASFGKPLWVTEVACTEYVNGAADVCTEAEATAFMEQIKSSMDDPANNVERYAWFGAFLDMASSGNANGIMNPDGTPNALGEAYLS